MATKKRQGSTASPGPAKRSSSSPRRAPRRPNPGSFAVGKRARNRRLYWNRGVEQWQLVGLITRRSLVRIQAPQPPSQVLVEVHRLRTSGDVVPFLPARPSLPGHQEAAAILREGNE